jgi:hypothetical protein
MGRGDGQRAELFVGEFLPGPAQVVRLGEDALRDRHHGFAGLGDLDQPLAVAHEHLHPELVLERADLLGNPGLRGMQRFRGLGHVQPAASDLGEVT